MLTMAIFWGVPMTLYLSFLLDGVPLFWVVGVCSVMALLFGGIWTFVFGRYLRRQIARLYAGDPAIVPAPPAGEFTTRVLANLGASLLFAASGHLYAGPDGLAFVPNSTNFRAQRTPRRAPWSAIQRIEPFTRPAPALLRLFSAAPLSYLRVVMTEGEWSMRVPEASRVGAALLAYKPPSAPAV